MQNNIYNLIDKARIISFDIFDTLVFRLFSSPEDIFRLMERELKTAGFAKEREAMQNKASMYYNALDGSPHANFEQIYDFFEKNSSIKIDKQAAKKCELMLEAELLRQNRQMYEIYCYALGAGKKIIAVSDMYFGKRELKPLLENCGYNEISEIYSSADCKRAKFCNTLFQYVCECEICPPSEILHIGDSLRDDYFAAKKQGLCAYHYNTPPKEKSEGLGLSLINGAARLIDEDFMYQLGAKIGGSLYPRLIYEIAKMYGSQKPNRIFFLSRDGYCLREIFKRLFPDIPSQYMYTSRRALLLCAIERLTYEELALLPPYTYGQSIGEILNYLGIEISEKSVASHGFAGSDTIIHNKDDADRLKALLYDNANIIEAEAERERAAFKGYLNKIGFGDGNYLLFDCGWSGSTQYLLERALKLIGCKAKTSFMYAGIAPSDKAQIQLNGRCFTGVFFDAGKNADIAQKIERSRAFIIAELFFSSGEPAIHRYVEKGLEPCPYGFSEELKKISAGIIESCIHSYRLLDKYNLIPDERASLAPLMRLIEAPTADEAEKIGNIENPDGFSALDSKKKFIAYVSEDDYKGCRLNELYWIAGLYARRDISAKIKKYIQAETNIPIKDIGGSRRPRLLGCNRIHRIFCSIAAEGIFTKVFIYKQIFEKYRKRYLAHTAYTRLIRYNSRLLRRYAAFDPIPLISIVVPVYNINQRILTECIESVLNQSADNFELILVDDCSTMPEVRKTLEKYRQSAKIKLIFRKTNGNISVCTNDGIAAAEGEYIALLDCDDTLARDAVYEITHAINSNGAAQLIYSDEDKISERGILHDPYFKPDFSPDTLLQFMYISHLSVYKTELIRSLGGFRAGYEGAQDYDLALRAAEVTDKIVHIPRVLYHWRERSGSIASGIEQKDYALSSVQRAKTDALERRGLKARLTNVLGQISVELTPKGEHSVAAVILSKNEPQPAQSCIELLRSKTKLKSLNITIVDSGSTAENREKYTELCQKYDVRYIYSPQEYNRSRLYNLGAASTDGEYLLFLSDRAIACSNERWLAAMLAQAELPHTGAVGMKLTDAETGTIISCGTVNSGRGPIPILMGYSDETAHYYYINKLNNNRIAVSDACLLIKRARFDAVHGFDTELREHYGDVGLCFSLYEDGLFNTVINNCCLKLSHKKESGQCELGQGRLMAELELLYKKHPSLRGYDPFYSINLAEGLVPCVRCDFLDYSIQARVRNFSCAELTLGIDSIKLCKTLDISGYAFVKACKSADLSKIYIILAAESGNYCFKASKTLRRDVSEKYSAGGKLNLCGFRAKIDTALLPNGSYSLILAVENPLKSGTAETGYKIKLLCGKAELSH